MTNKWDHEVTQIPPALAAQGIGSGRQAAFEQGNAAGRHADGLEAVHSPPQEKMTERRAKVLTRDEARRMAVNFAKVPELLGKADA